MSVVMVDYVTVPILTACGLLLRKLQAQLLRGG